jgi:hypothetical protein
MRRLLAWQGAALVLLAGAAALGAPPDAPAPRLFLSPSGEPFRSPAGGPDPFEAWFDQADTDHDGSLDRAEFLADAERFFAKLDANHDGVLDGFEINDYEAKIAPELIAGAEGPLDEAAEAGHKGRGGGDRRGHGRREEAGGGIERLLAEAEPVTGAEYELNGHVSHADWVRATKERFDLLDSSKTGRLTREALRAKLHPPNKTRNSSED